MPTTIHLSGRRPRIALLVAVWLGGAASGLAQNDGSPDVRAEFERVYADYEAAVNAGELETAMDLSDAVVELGRRAFGAGSEQVAQLALNHAKLLELSGRDAAAHDAFVKLIDRYDERYGSESLRHVPLYARRGNDELVTKHSVALGSITSWPSKQEYEPILKITPYYPRSALRDGREGSVVVEYTVDETGTVVDPVVVSSEGGADFEQPALDSLKGYRYIPRVVDGEPVAVHGVQTTIRFRLAR